MHVHQNLERFGPLLPAVWQWHLERFGPLLPAVSTQVTTSQPYGAKWKTCHRKIQTFHNCAAWEDKSKTKNQANIISRSKHHLGILVTLSVKGSSSVKGINDPSCYAASLSTGLDKTACQKRSYRSHPKCCHTHLSPDATDGGTTSSSPSKSSSACCSVGEGSKEGCAVVEAEPSLLLLRSCPDLKPWTFDHR